MAGFTSGGGPAGRAGEQQDPAGAKPPFMVSPKLLLALKDVRGAALAITDFDPRQPPRGVLVINTGRSDLLQGIIETALSGATASEMLQPGEPIEGHPTYQSPFGTVIATERLVIAGNPADLAVEALHRLQGRADLPSLAGTEAFKELKAQRGQGLLFAYVDGKRAVDLAKRATAPDGRPSHEYEMLQAAADVESLRWAALRLGT